MPAKGESTGPIGLAWTGHAVVDVDFKGIGAAADTLRLAEDKTQPGAVSRRSARTWPPHRIGGFVGVARYEGEAIGEQMPLLRMAEVVHVGRHSAFGSGMVVVDG